MANQSSGADCSGSFWFAYSLESGISCGGTAITNNTGNIQNTNPMLRPLANYGGPTLTMALLPGSTAIDSSTCDLPSPTTDQRGIARPQGTKCDLGAFEVVPVNVEPALVTTLAGTAGVAGTTDGTGPAASFHWPYGITSDGANLYVTDSFNNTVRKIVIATGAVSTFAGQAGVIGHADGAGTAATFYGPTGITTDGTNLYVADMYNCTIRKIVIATGVVSTFAGTTLNCGLSPTRYNHPRGITTDGVYLYIADSDNNAIRGIRLVDKALSPLATQIPWPNDITTDGKMLYVTSPSTNVVYDLYKTDGSIANIRQQSGFNFPQGITTDGFNLYISNTYDHTIITQPLTNAGSTIKVIAGTAGSFGSTDGANALFNLPVGITTDGTNLYVADWGNNTIRKLAAPISSYALSVTKAGTFGFGTGTVTSSPAGINCGATCSYAFNAGTVVTLTATPDTGSILKGWSGGGCTGTGTCTVTMNAATAVTATFDSAPCTYTISPASQTFTTTGGTGTVTVTASASSCAWTASSPLSWTTITSGSGTGSGTVTISVSANTTGASRTGNITIAGQTFTITQAGAAQCTYSIFPTSQTGDANALSGAQISVTVSSGCAWTAVSNASWITITSGSSGTGSGTVIYSVSANTGASSRTGTITVAGQTFTYTQAGAAQCYSISPTSQTFTSNGGPGSINVTTQTNCGWGATASDTWITISSPGPLGTINSGTVSYSVSNNTTGSARAGTITVFDVTNNSISQTFTITQSDRVFADVAPTNVFYSYINAIYNAGITVGCNQNPLMYCPDTGVTRGQMAAFIIRAKYIPNSETFTYTVAPYFSDVPATNVFFKYVQRLKDDAITVVTGTYGVNDVVTRGQMAAFIIRAKYGENFTYTQTPYFSDVPATNVFFKYVQKLKDTGITVVTGTYGVNDVVTRGQMAAFIARAFLGMP